MFGLILLTLFTAVSYLAVKDAVILALCNVGESDDK